MIYYLPLEIAGTRFHIASLDPIVATNQNPPPTKQYILSKHAVQTHLFNIDANSYLIAHGGMDADLDWSSFDIDFKSERNQLIINIKTTSHTDDLIHDTQPYVIADNAPVHCSKTTSTHIQIKGQKHENIAIALKASVEGTVEVVLNLVNAENQVTHTGNFTLHIVPNSNIWEVALDFGSEASQLYIPRANDGAATNALPMIEHLKRTFYAEHEKTIDSDFMQSDPDGFFRSVFLRASEGVLQQADAPNTPNELVQMLTSFKSMDALKTQKYKLLPTVKLATFGIGGAEIVKVNGQNQIMSNLVDKIHRKLIFNFLHTACKTITSDRDRYIRFKLLVPNVFNQTKVTNMVEKIERDSIYFIRDFPAYRLKGIEISTLSESDAAFAGYHPPQDKPIIANGNYLIIDVGRGTTDYSIVQTTAATKAVGLYRSGFIGAGALLTFAFLDTFVTQMMKDHYVALGKESEFSKKDRELFCKKVICEADATWQTKFFQLMERLKRVSGRKLQIRDKLIAEVTDIKKIPNLLKVDLNTVNNWLENALDHPNNRSRSMPDSFGFIQQTTHALIQHLLTEIQKIPNVFAEIDRFDGVILSGRGSLYAPLVTALKAKFGPDKVHLANNLKNICIEGAFTDHRFNGNCNMIGIPYAAEVFGNKQTIKPQPILVDAPEPPKKNSLLSLIGIGLDSLFSDTPAAKTKSKQKQTKANYYRDIEAFMKGYGDTNFNGATEKIYISGQNYKHGLGEMNGSVNLFFTGRFFLIRTQTVAETLEPMATLETEVERNFAAKTLFPTLGASNRVPVDKIPDLNPPL